MRIARSTTTHVLLAAVMLAFCIPAQALDLMAPFKNLFGADETIVWQGPGQFVKVVEQDRIKKDRRPTKNSHPADLTAAQLAAVLASLKVESTGKSVAVFTQAEVALLAEKLAEAFDKALPTQDVVFAIAGGPNGAAANRLTAGRVFLQGARLQIIFGDVHGPAGGDADNLSHHAKPHRAGKRKEAVDKDVVIATGPGIVHYMPSERSRTDWILIDVPAVVAAYRGPALVPAPPPAAVPIAAPGMPAPAPQAAPVAAAPAAATAPPITAEQQKLLEERRQMLEEMARLRKQVQDQEAAGGAAPAEPAAPARPPAAATAATAAKPGGKSIEERLATLQALHEKKLITDEEYASKRKALLEEL